MFIDPVHGDATPRAWSFGWLELSRWVTACFPSQTQRRARALEAMGHGLDDGDRIAVHDALNRMLAAHSWPGLGPLCEHLEHLRGQHDAPALVRLELGLRMLDAAKRFLSPNPFAYALEAVGWSTVPPEHRELAIELGLFVRVLAHGASSSPSVPAIGEDEELLEDDEEIFEGYRSVGSRPAPPEGRGPIPNLARVAERLAGCTPSLERWRQLEGPPERRGDHRVLPLPRYLLEMIERFPRTEPRCLELYELIADTSEPELLGAVERAARVFAETLGSPLPLAHTRLRAAVRRVATEEHDEEAIDLAVDAFGALSQAGDREAACLAACIVGQELALEDPREAAEWLEQAWTMAGERESPGLRAAILLLSFHVHQEVGNELGQRQVTERARRLSREHVGLEELLDALESPAPELDDDDEAEHEPLLGPPRALVLAEEAFFERGPRVAYEAVSDLIGGLFETCDRDEVVERLVAMAEHPALFVALRGWLYEALADLLDDEPEHWAAYKAQQLRAEDELQRRFSMVLSEVDAEPRHEPDERKVLEARVRWCIAEAEQALEQGIVVRARFWAEQARHYREALGR